jgi:non-ribosomal peptide synthetase component F
VIVRTTIHDGEPFLDVLRRVRSRFLDAHSHRDVPYAAVVASLARSRTRAGAEPTPVCFNFLPAFANSTAFPGLTIAASASDPAVSKRELTLTIRDTRPEFAGAFVYDAELFDGTTARALAGWYRELIEVVTAEPAGAVARLVRLTRAAQPRSATFEDPLEGDRDAAFVL